MSCQEKIGINFNTIAQIIIFIIIAMVVRMVIDQVVAFDFFVFDLVLYIIAISYPLQKGKMLFIKKNKDNI